MENDMQHGCEVPKEMPRGHNCPPPPPIDVRPGVICEVCGHVNPPDTGICEMCSNYLFDKQRR